MTSQIKRELLSSNSGVTMLPQTADAQVCQKLKGVSANEVLGWPLKYLVIEWATRYAASVKRRDAKAVVRRVKRHIMLVLVSRERVSVFSDSFQSGF